MARNVFFRIMWGNTSEAVEAGEECMVLPSGTDREESNPVVVSADFSRCKIIHYDRSEKILNNGVFSKY